MIGSVASTPAPVTTQRWGDVMESVGDQYRFLVRNCWRWWESYILVGGIAAFTMLGVHYSVKDAMIRQVKGELGLIKSQNQTSIDDRAYLHDELRNTRAALRRLEAKVQSGEQQ